VETICADTGIGIGLTPEQLGIFADVGA
jgi:hypothetical protein